jgi:hypothetical protein
VHHGGDESGVQQLAGLENRGPPFSEVGATTTEQSNDEQRIRLIAAGPGDEPPSLAGTRSARPGRHGPRASREILDDGLVVEDEVAGSF